MNPHFVPRREQPSLSSYVTKSYKYIPKTQTSVSRREYGAPPYHHPYKVDKAKGSYHQWGALGANCKSFPYHASRASSELSYYVLILRLDSYIARYISYALVFSCTYCTRSIASVSGMPPEILVSILSNIAYNLATLGRHPPFQPNGKPKGVLRLHSRNSRAALALTGARLRVGDNTGYICICYHRVTYG